MKSASTLLVMITNKCNLTCSFCAADYAMQGKQASGEDLAKELVESLTKHPDIKQITWSGGETLSATRRLKELVSLANSIRPNLSHQLITNGYFLTEELAEYINDTFQYTVVSIDGYESSERSLTDLVYETNRRIVNALTALNKPCITTVVTKEQLNNPAWYQDIMKLHEAVAFFKPSLMTLRLDSEMESPLNTDQVLNFTYGFLKLRKSIADRNDSIGDEVDLNVGTIFPSETCCTGCSRQVRILADANLEQFKDQEPIEGLKGCSKMARSIGIDNYKYISKVIYG